MTADDNDDLTGVTVKNVEIINITGADNLGSTTTESETTTDAAKAGKAAVDSVKLDLSGVSLKGQVDVIDFGDFIAAGEDAELANAGLSVLLGGVAALPVPVEDGDTGAEIAAAMADAINTKAGGEEAEGFLGATATALGGKVTINWATNDGENATLYNPGDVTVASAEAADGETEALVGAATQITSGFGEEAGDVGMTTTAPSATISATLQLGGVDIALTDIEAGAEAGNIVIGNWFATADDGEGEDDSATVTAEKVKIANLLKDQAIAKIDEYYKATVDASAGDSNGEILLTNSALGDANPSVKITINDTQIASLDAEDSQAVASVEKTLATGALKETRTVTFDPNNGEEDTGVDADDTYNLLIDGVDYGTITATGEGAAAATNTAKATADAINLILGDNTATNVGNKVTITAATAGTHLPDITLNPGAEMPAVSYAITQQNADVLTSTTTTTTTTTAASITASSFAGAEQIWLKGTSGSTAVKGVSTQTIGFSGVSAMDNTVTTTAVNQTIAIASSKGTLTMAGTKLTTLTLAGTGTSGTGVTLEESATTDIEALVSATSAAARVNVAGLTDLETITSGEGGIRVDGATDAVHTITAAGGSNSLQLVTATAEDVVGTAKDETQNALLTTGAGADKVKVATDGAGTVTVDTGAGADTLLLDNGEAEGEVTIALGAGNDTLQLANALADLNTDTMIDGGDGIDTILTEGDAKFTAGEYTLLNNYTTGFEAMGFQGAMGATAAIDASKLANIVSYSFYAGNNFIEEVSTGTSLLLSSLVRGSATAPDYLETLAVVGATGLTASAAGYEADTDFTDDESDATYGGSLNVTVAGLINATPSVTVNAASATVTIASTVYATAAGDLSVAPNVTVDGQVESLTVALSSGRGATKDVNLGTEYMATFTLDIDAGTDAEDVDAMQALTDITVVGTGSVDIDLTTDADSEDADYEPESVVLVDLSGMTDFEGLDAEGDPEGAGGTYENKAVASIALNDAVAETVKLGGALDTVTTGSTYEFMDSIEGFALVATASEDDDEDVIDDDLSDVIDITGDVYTFVADDTEYASLDAALLTVAEAADAISVFHAEGNTYLYVNDGTAGLDDADILLELVGVYDLDQLVNAAS